ncbi:50S ribosomal protein L24 [Dermatophilus congolensis]|nr:50S ribosomal protein L24 [Dermatophilus congolensis]MBO3131612.1 50S ribosomal protein L24 [Dermatophilus congolensis]MBO3134232.1 50S ribosomal protein L24 [Dermatophilus congolensis]MBO3136465.1 50S ribosomal protein L24 [Dermatophilus congolensis]MBO3138714.1 50S ribosomal protein L24 [Dermatophilus congolensis]
MKIKKGDLVQVITGRKQDKGGDRGKQGKVIAVFPDTNRVLVEGINRVTKHQRAAAGTNRAAGIVTVEAPIHVSNVALVDPETNKPTRVRMRTEKVERNGREKTVRVRVAVRSGKDI